MAVEARLSLFPSQLIATGGGGGNHNHNSNREMMTMMNNVNYQYGGGGGLPPLSGTTTENFLPMYSSVMAESIPPPPAKTAVKAEAESGLSYSLPYRKRPRVDSSNHQFVPYLNNGQIQIQNQMMMNSDGYTFLGEDISYQIQQQQMDIDHLIAQHTEEVRREVEERRRRCSRRIMAAVEENVMKRLRVKEEEMERMGKLNWALEERVRSLVVENQIWRELAQTNQATANALRSNLEQIIHHNTSEAAAADLADDAESCCGSNDVDYNGGAAAATSGGGGCGGGGRVCRECGKEEACVLVLPCRHLCLCTVCGSSVHTCPVCKTPKNASVHVNMSSSS